MSRLAQAMEAAEARKQAALGGEANGLVYSDGELQDRMLLGGFDLDYDELSETATRVADYFAHMALMVGLRSLFTSAWVDGLLTGLLAATLPTPSESAPPPGSEG